MVRNRSIRSQVAEDGVRFSNGKITEKKKYEKESPARKKRSLVYIPFVISGNSTIRVHFEEFRGPMLSFFQIHNFKLEKRENKILD